MHFFGKKIGCFSKRKVGGRGQWGQDSGVEKNTGQDILREK